MVINHGIPMSFDKVVKTKKLRNKLVEFGDVLYDFTDGHHYIVTACREQVVKNRNRRFISVLQCTSIADAMHQVPKLFKRDDLAAMAFHSNITNALEELLNGRSITYERSATNVSLIDGEVRVTNWSR